MKKTIKIKESKRIDRWCNHFVQFGTANKDEDMSAFDCQDCALHNTECPYEFDNKTMKPLD